MKIHPGWTVKPMNEISKLAYKKLIYQANVGNISFGGLVL